MEQNFEDLKKRADNGDIQAAYSVFENEVARVEKRDRLADYPSMFYYGQIAADGGNTKAMVTLGKIFKEFGENNYHLGYTADHKTWLFYSEDYNATTIDSSSAFEIPSNVWIMNCGEFYKYFAKAAEINNSEGAFLYGECLYHGIEGPDGTQWLKKDTSEAYKWMQKAYKGGFVNGKILSYFSDYYLFGLPPCSVDKKKAFDIMRHAVTYEDCFIGVNSNLANACYNGDGIPVDYETAFELCEKMQEDEYQEVMSDNDKWVTYSILANSYKEGKGTSKSLGKSLSYSWKAYSHSMGILALIVFPFRAIYDILTYPFAKSEKSQSKIGLPEIDFLKQ